MTNNYFPKIDQKKLCETMHLCSIRKNEEDKNLVAIKDKDWNITEVESENIVHLNEYKWVSIDRIYCSGHVVFNKEKTHVYLITTEKNWVIQHQFTWWSPKEEHLKKATFVQDWKIKFLLDVVEINAEIRAKKRINIDITENYNRIPTIDRVMNYNADKNWNPAWTLVCLIHFVAKTYEWDPTPQIWIEWVIWWGWFPVDNLENQDGVAPNTKIIVDHSLENLRNWSWESPSTLFQRQSLLSKAKFKVRSLTYFLKTIIGTLNKKILSLTNSFFA